jgi:alpha-tubulin suppressor-like RCC1 family protein
MHVDKQQPVPKLIIPLLRETVVAVSSYNGCHHCLALTDKNKIYAWGANGQGQLGLSDNDFRNTPQLIPFIFDEKITGISAGGHEDYGFSVITCENMVFTFGYNANGQLALGTFDSVQESSPKKALIERVTKVGTGDFHAIFLTSDGSVLNVGSNEKGQLGQGHFDNSSVPVRVTFFDDKHVIDVIAGADVSLALTEALELYSWGGQHDRYQIATFTIGSTPSLLTHMSSSQPVRVVRGYQHGLALTKSGKIVVGGYNNLGQIGTGKRDDIVYNEARELDFFQDATIVFIGCGDNHSFCLTN